ncbi:MAG TPA: glycosyltransferase [Intrasporangium sp.]|uniref:glycosyltransferase n=1 Tax=Intrasporangium sp. TaxID=1925024 RepID=UPI002D779336|nr:glycosyltransferase [Intrasporangium sp.]HET7399935.1 glycosyltransferase [Intrasporangium sp.]
MSIETAEQPATAGVEARPDGDTLLARVVFPGSDSTPDLVPVYVRSDTQGAGSPAGFEITGRRSLTIDKGGVVSFDSFFNAFPAAQWRRWTSLTDVVLEVELRGRSRVDVYRSSGSGRVTHEASQLVADADVDAVTVRLVLPVARRFADGGHYWFTVCALDDCEMVRAEWRAEEPVAVRGATIGICTFNRVDDCVATMKRLIDDPQSVTHIRELVVVDQGTQLVSDHPDFAEVAAAWGGRVRIVRQPNLGGSGGFSRAMYEVLQREDGGDVILTDDDISPEPESFHRAVMFAGASDGRVLVHGHMMDLWAQSRLHNTGDLVDRSTFRTRAVAGGLEDIDLRTVNLSNEPRLSHRYEADFGGWWMCLLPRNVLAEVGLAMPVFIKWDDVEYGLRARESGYPTVTLPGVAVWHQPFYLKDVQTDWTAYFEARNRLLTAVVHGRPEELRSTIVDNVRIVTKNALTMNYSALALNAMAISDLLKGPDFIADDLPTVMQRVREVRAAYSDARVLDDVPADFTSTVGPVEVDRLTRRPRGRVEGAVKIAGALVATARRGLPGKTVKTADLSGLTAHWAVLARLDTAVVATADGAGVTLRRRDTRVMRRQLRESARLHAELLRRADELQETYRATFRDWVSPASWRRYFE